MKYLYDAKNKAIMMLDKLKRLEVLSGFKCRLTTPSLKLTSLITRRCSCGMYPDTVEKLTGVKMSAFEFSNVPTPTAQGLKSVVLDIKPAARDTYGRAERSLIRPL
jgi:hypothetical protein